MSANQKNYEPSVPLKPHINGSIYLYKNDPKVINKGVNVSNFRHSLGGFLPLLGDSNYLERKLDNTSYVYDDKIHHGSRPQHQTTFSLNQNEYQPNSVTQNKFDYQGHQLGPNDYSKHGSDQFKTQIDIGMSNNERSLITSYQNQFYFKNSDEQYKKNFEIMPKYSVPKQIYQLENNKLTIPVNRQSNIKKALVMNENENNYWSEYNSKINYLGAKRGPGADLKDFPDRPSYDPLTGEQKHPAAWSSKRRYNRISGDSFMHVTRRENRNILN